MLDRLWAYALVSDLDASVGVEGLVYIVHVILRWVSLLLFQLQLATVGSAAFLLVLVEEAPPRIVLCSMSLRRSKYACRRRIDVLCAHAWSPQWLTLAQNDFSRVSCRILVLFFRRLPWQRAQLLLLHFGLTWPVLGALIMLHLAYLASGGLKGDVLYRYLI